MYRAVLDTNVFISGATINTGAPSRIMNHWRNRDFVMIASPQLLTEYEDVLSRPRIMKYTNLTSLENMQYVQQIKERAYVTNGTLTVGIITSDPDDNIVLACAEEGMATHVVTGNRRHFPFKEYKGIHVVTPREFLNLLEH